MTHGEGAAMASTSDIVVVAPYGARSPGFREPVICGMRGPLACCCLCAGRGAAMLFLDSVPHRRAAAKADR